MADSNIKTKLFKTKQEKGGERGSGDRDQLSDNFPDGYSKFAAFIVADPDKSTTIFRRFDQVTARNLLILESEIAELEAQLDSIEKEGDGPDFLASEQSWDMLSN
ncbi:hypothetical protein K432DRAFT_391296 [Lepidopterella palustris CBS 459.81]|uniref:DUF6594 domain-containing protein n=1 Tax=Lepidopterella palustris CBS 459.81 TaxID=1314670 RepID=A0A8E2JHQ1_9PEZI|nr:hypothetical protein K432DRAFT_391296 [Lepidopterella palustris CBS 459.81]